MIKMNDLKKAILLIHSNICILGISVYLIDS